MEKKKKRRKKNYADGKAVGIAAARAAPRIDDVSDMPTATVGIGPGRCALDR